MITIFVSLFTLFAMTLQAQTFNNPKVLFDPSPYGFSHLATVPAGSKLVFVAGQTGEETKEFKLSPDFRTQVQFALRNIEHALKETGITMNAVVKVTTLVVGHNAEKLQIIAEEFKKMWPAKNCPVNTLIPVPRLALDKVMIEIDAIAVTNE